jgi:hypothetical protein
MMKVRRGESRESWSDLTSELPSSESDSIGCSAAVWHLCHRCSQFLRVGFDVSRQGVDLPGFLDGLPIDHRIFAIVHHSGHETRGAKERSLDWPALSANASQRGQHHCYGRKEAVNQRKLHPAVRQGSAENAAAGRAGSSFSHKKREQLVDPAESVRRRTPSQAISALRAVNRIHPLPWTQRRGMAQTRRIDCRAIALSL